MLKPEDHYWMYLVGGFKGLLTMIGQAKVLCRDHKDKPPQMFIMRLRQVRDEISKEIEELEKWQ